ncbi:MAG TPA: hypothetical protein VMR52_08705 [Dehalococcoidia bacterium]|nr:hypothetical protein [Dehalococcoidia bacterium]
MGQETADRALGYRSNITPEQAQLIRHLGIIGIAGVSLGLIVGGVGGRIVMRIAAIAAPDRVEGSLTENGNAIGAVTVGGTIELLIFVGILLGAVGAVIYAASERWLRWAGSFSPIAFALLILMVGSPEALDHDNRDFLLVGNYELMVGLFVGLFLLYSVPLPFLIKVLEERLPRVDPTRPLDSIVGYLSLASLGSLFAILITVLLISEADVAAALVLVGMGLATILFWVTDYTDFDLAPLPGLGRILGYGSLVGAVALGSVQTWRNIESILAGDFF